MIVKIILGISPLGREVCGILHIKNSPITEDITLVFLYMLTEPSS
jgi:hypothetical protein